jgi:hypothetical protein
MRLLRRLLNVVASDLHANESIFSQLPCVLQAVRDYSVELRRGLQRADGLDRVLPHADVHELRPDINHGPQLHSA